MTGRIRQLKKHLESLLYPEAYVCPVCGREALLGETGVCAGCREVTRRCGLLPSPAPLEGISANYFYDPALRSVMHRFKYGHELWLARFLMRDIRLPADISFDAVIPVPMHPLKEYLRTCNPPEALALALHEQHPTLSIRTDLLKKTRLTPSQTAMAPAQRSTNVKNAFRASGTVRGMTILLVDDVTTTGSTLIACAEALKSAGALHVLALCACKAGIGEDAAEESDPPDKKETEI